MRSGRFSDRVYFLDVGQGDSELIAVKGARFLLDGGPDRSVVRELDRILGPARRYVDFLILTHPNADHLSGLREVLKSYEVGAFIYARNQRNDRALKTFLEELNQKEIPVIGLGEDDKIYFADAEMDILSPEAGESFEDTNDASLVIILKTSFGRTLFAADISALAEEKIAAGHDIRAEMLKVGHHGSNRSSTREFLEAVRPAAAIIEVGKNSYGHPGAEAQRRLEAAGAKVYRTDLLGTLTAVFGEEGFKIMKIR